MCYLPCVGTLCSSIIPRSGLSQRQDLLQVQEGNQIDQAARSSNDTIQPEQSTTASNLLVDLLSSTEPDISSSAAADHSSLDLADILSIDFSDQSVAEAMPSESTGIVTPPTLTDTLTPLEDPMDTAVHLEESINIVDALKSTDIVLPPVLTLPQNIPQQYMSTTEPVPLASATHALSQSPSQPLLPDTTHDGTRALLMDAMRDPSQRTSPAQPPSQALLPRAMHHAPQQTSPAQPPSQQFLPHGTQDASQQHIFPFQFFFPATTHDSPRTSYNP